MYLPSDFQVTDPSQIFALVRSYPFALLVTAEGDRAFTTPLPFNLRESEGAQGTLYAHLSRHNQHAKALSRNPKTQILFQGPNAYISPNWYPKAAADHIPTWNYIMVEAQGELETFDSRDELITQINWLIDENDPTDYTLAATEEEKENMLPQILGIRMRVESWTAKFKLNQNREYADAQSVQRELSKSQDSGHQAMAQWMKRLKPAHFTDKR